MTSYINPNEIYADSCLDDCTLSSLQKDRRYYYGGRGFHLLQQGEWPVQIDTGQIADMVLKIINANQEKIRNKEAAAPQTVEELLKELKENPKLVEKLDKQLQENPELMEKAKNLLAEANRSIERADEWVKKTDESIEKVRKQTAKNLRNAYEAISRAEECIAQSKNVVANDQHKTKPHHSVTWLKGFVLFFWNLISRWFFCYRKNHLSD